MSWVDAIKKYSEQTKSKFVIPKRDSPEYAAIRAIQETLAKAVAPATGTAAQKKKASKKVAANEVAVPVIAVAEVLAKPTKPAKPAKKENVDVVPEVIVEVPEVKIVKKRKVIAKPAEVVEVAEVVAPVKEVKVKRVKIIKRENVEAEPAPEPIPEVKRESTIQEERTIKRAAKQARLEEQGKKAGEFALAQTRMMISARPILLDFS